MNRLWCTNIQKMQELLLHHARNQPNVVPCQWSVQHVLSFTKISALWIKTWLILEACIENERFEDLRPAARFTKCILSGDMDIDSFLIYTDPSRMKYYQKVNNGIRWWILPALGSNRLSHKRTQFIWTLCWDMSYLRSENELLDYWQLKNEMARMRQTKKLIHLLDDVAI